MKKIILFFFMGLLCAGCASELPARAAGLQDLQIGTPTARASAPAPKTTARATATPDILMIAQSTQAALAVELAQAQNTASISKVTSEAIWTQVAMTETRATQDANLRASATMSITQTGVTRALKTQDAALTATVQAPITRRLETQADWEPVWQSVKCSVTIILSTLAMLLAIKLANAKLLQIQEQRAHFRSLIGNPPEQPAQQTLKVKLDNQDVYGWGSINFSSCPIDKATLLKVARMIVAGNRYTERQMTGADNPLVKGGSYDSFGGWMVNNHIAIELDDGRYLVQHHEFFERVLKNDVQ